MQHDPEAMEPLAPIFSGRLAADAQEIARAAAEMFPELPDMDRCLCANVVLATWAHELDKVGELDLSARSIAYLYQAGRIAVQELQPDILPRLEHAVGCIIRQRRPAP